MNEPEKPNVVGGVLLECVGGPFDGQLAYLAYGDIDFGVWHFYDDKRTPWLKSGGHRYADNFMGEYWQTGGEQFLTWCQWSGFEQPALPDTAENAE